MLRRCVLATALALAAVPATASAAIPGLTQRDANALVGLAHQHWPAGPCGGHYTLYVRSAGPVAVAQAPCTIVVNARARLSATDWCTRLKPVFARLAAGTKPSPVPYRCGLAVGPRPAKPSLVAPRGVSRADALAAFAVAETHWPNSPCKGREQVVLAPESVLLLGSAEQPIAGVTIMGEAALHDSHCVVYLNSGVQWTPSLLCSVVVHEEGHLLGLEHSSDPNSVMSPVGARAPECEAAFGPAPLGVSTDPKNPAPAPTTPVGSPTGFGTLSSG